MMPVASTSVAAASVAPETAVQRYIRHVYADLFNRAPDPEGLATWTTALTNGTPRVEVANAITSSTEYRTGLITGSYQHYLGRGPDPAGLGFWLEKMSSGWTVSQIESGFIASDEYYAKAGSTPDGWVTKLYADVLGRTAAPSEVQWWTQRLASGSSRSEVAMGFLLSTEHLDTVVTGYYQHLLGRGLDPTGQATWVGILQAGGRNEAIIGGIIASDEYWGKTAAAPGAVSGTVTDAGGSHQGLAQIWVNVSSPSSGAFGFASTAADGSYTVTGLPAGTDYQVCFDGQEPMGGGSGPPWYIGQCYNNQPMVTATAVSVTVDATTDGIDAALVAGGAIQGTVTDAEGINPGNVNVTVYVHSPSTGYSWWRGAALGHTFGVNVPAGTDYQVCFSAPGYVDQCYNNQPMGSTPTPVSVTVGAATSGITAVLVKAP